MPNAEVAKFSIVVWLSYLIGVGGLTHVVVGSAEVPLLPLDGSITLTAGPGVLLPTLAGNVIGGTLRGRPGSGHAYNGPTRYVATRQRFRRGAVVRGVSA